jgi:tetratricopeptide (TPR) repeat protein
VSEEEMARLINSYQPATDDPVALLLDAAGILGGRRAVLLARRALEIRPDCREAYLVLADAEPDPARALALYDRARGLVEQELGLTTDELEPEMEDPEVDDALRALEGMAQALCALGRPEEAAVHLRQVLRLDPDDLLGAWTRLASTLFVLGRDEEVKDLLADSPDEGSTAWTYTQALLAFRQEGDSPAARQALGDALHRNALVPGLILPRLHLSLRRGRLGCVAADAGGSPLAGAEKREGGLGPPRDLPTFPDGNMILLEDGTERYAIRR